MTHYYVGCKQVLAWEQEKDGKEGYAVKYPDGYISWSPKEVFEKAYILQGEDPTRVNEEMVENFISSYDVTRMGNHTVLFVKLVNGFTFITDSACVDSNNYDENIGKDLALKKAKSKVWEYLGFLLATAKNGI